MRILHVIPAIALRYGGPSQLAIEMCQWLRQSIPTVDLVTTNADGAGELDVVLDRWVDYQGVNTRFFNRDFSEAFKYSAGLSRWVNRNVAKYDVVHIHAVFSHSSITTASACIKQKIPYIIRPLGTLDPWSMAQKPFRKKLFLALKVRKILKRANAIHYTATLEKKFTESSLGIEKGVVIPNGINNTMYQGEFDPETFERRFENITPNAYLLFLGRIAPKKNLEGLLEAFTEVKNMAGYEALELVIAGQGENDYVETIDNAVRNHPYSEFIYKSGWVSGTEKTLLLKGAKLFVLPSHNENYGIATAESLASGVPVLISDQVYLYPEIIEAKAGWVWEAGSSLAQSIDNALQADDFSQRGVNGSQLVTDRYSWPSVVSKLEELYSGFRITEKDQI